MAGSLNKVMLIGNLGKDPEVRQTQDGQKIVNFTLATNEVWKDKATGERRDKTEWHRVVVFNEKLADVCEKFVKKGTKVYLEGQIQTRKWTDAQGQERITTEVVLPRFRGELSIISTAGSSNGSAFDAPEEAVQVGGDNNKNQSIIDDEIPF